MFAIKTEKGYLARQDNRDFTSETWFQDKVTGWVVVGDKLTLIEMAKHFL